MERSWRYRRLAFFAGFFFCMGILIYIAVLGEDTMLNREIASGAWMFMGAAFGTYVAGAAWDDRNKAREIIQGLPPQV